VSALGGTPRFHRASLIPQAQDALATEEHERGRRVVVVLDEAHLLDAEQLEGLRLLTNADLDSRSPFSCLLVGQPTLRRRIRLGAFAALDQRVALRYSMTPGVASERFGLSNVNRAPIEALGVRARTTRPESDDGYHATRSHRSARP
jgi:type II secretory pathway predicted ATPase ExeA